MFCPHCGKEIGEHQAFCQFCGGAAAVPPAAATPGRENTPWEEERTRWTLRGLMTTLKESLFSPSEFFRRMNVTGGLTDPLLFSIIAGMSGITLFYLWQMLLHDTAGGFLPDRAAGGLSLIQSAGSALSALFMPFLLIVLLFLWSGILHLLLLLVRGANRPFEATFRVAAYSSGTLVLLGVPYCSMLLFPLWLLTSTVIGLREAHGTTGAKATLAVLFPMLLCCAVVAAFSLLVLGTVAASLGTLSNQPWR
jgi:hypothetical protein